MKIKIPKKWLWVVIPLAILLPVQILNQTGFCYSEMRYLSERQLIDRFLFKSDEMSLDEKVKILEERRLDEKYPTWVTEYPECCRIIGQIQRTSLSDRFWNNFFGLYFYSLHMVSERAAEDVSRVQKNDPYYRSFTNLGTCGFRVPDAGGTPTSEAEYNSIIQRNRLYWQENES